MNMDWEPPNPGCPCSACDAIKRTIEHCAKIVRDRLQEWEDSDPVLDCPCYQKAAEMLKALANRVGEQP